MGDRARIVFFDSHLESQTVYLHWHGTQVPAWLCDLKQRMHGRFSDAQYAAARFVGICHSKIEGNLSLGILSNRLSQADLQCPHLLKGHQHHPGHAAARPAQAIDRRGADYRPHPPLAGNSRRARSGTRTQCRDRSSARSAARGGGEFYRQAGNDVPGTYHPGAAAQR